MSGTDFATHTHHNTNDFKAHFQLYRDWNATKTIFAEKPKTIKLEELNSSHTGRLTISCENKNFEAVFLPSTTKKLYVFLTAHANCQYPIFIRRSWSQYLDGCVLYIDDLTRLELCQNNLYIGVTFFYGTPDEDYIKYYLYKIIHKCLSLYTIDVSNLVFISSSNGGFTALRLACLFEGSTALAYNPQFSIQKYYHNQLAQAEKVFDFTNIERTDIVDTMLQTSSNLFIFSNIASGMDNLQIEHLKKKINTNLIFGLNQITQTIYLYLTKCFSVFPHGDQPDEQMTLVILKFLSNPEQYYSLLECAMKVFQRNLDIVKKFTNQKKEYEYELFWRKYTFEIIQALPDDLYVQNMKTNIYYITFFITKFPQEIHYELILMRNTLFFSVHCHLNKNQVKNIVMEKFNLIKEILAIGTGADFIQNDGLMLNKEITKYNIVEITLEYIKKTLPILKQIDAVF